MEVLQPEISGLPQQTNLEELKSWINEGKLSPSSKVRVKHLLWMEAGQVPALKKLFESRKENPPATSNQSQNSSFPLNSKPFKINSDAGSAPVPLKKPDSPPTASSIDAKPETAEPSAAFKAFEKKALARTKQIKETPAPKQPLPIPKRKTSLLSLLKNVLVFSAGCLLMFSLAWGGSYLWIFQLRPPLKIDEKSVTELVILENKLTTDKVGLRLKISAAEQEAAATGNPESSAPKADYAQELAKLEKQYETQRKIIIENHRINLVNNDFNNTFYLSFAVLMILFILVRIFYGRSNKPAESTASSSSRKLQTTDSPNIQKADKTEVEVENSQDQHITNPSAVHITNTSGFHNTRSADLHTTGTSSGKIETIDEYLQNPEFLSYMEPDRSRNCLMHRDAAAKFICETCSNYFCAVCPQTIGSAENCCPFCKVSCQPADSIKTEAIRQRKIPGDDVQVEVLESESKTISNFTMHEFPDKKPYKIGIFASFFIALFLSAPGSYFWVYKISPQLENREVAQNSAGPEPEKNKPANISETSANTNTANANTHAANTNQSVNEADGKCIDPTTNQPFECDNETRRALEDHTRKTKSVADAKKQVSEKTTTILSLILPSEKSSNEDSNKEVDPVEEERKENNKRKFIQIFLVSFVVLFGLLFSTRFFGKKQN